MTVRGIDPAGLCLRDAIDLAILIEEEAKERYEEFADQMELHRTFEAARFFRFMAGNEEKHRADLDGRRQSLFGNEPRAVTRGMLWDVEAPDYDEARAFMTPRQAMLTALRCEEKAHDFFAHALPHLKDPEVRDLFEELRSEEVDHQRLVREQLAKLPEDPEAAADDFGDEPVGQ